MRKKLTSIEKKKLDVVLQDVEKGRNLEGPFHSAEEFISSLKK